MRKFLRCISAVLAISLLMVFSVYAENFGSCTAKLFNTYDDEMLFQHSEKAVIAGTAQSGSEISCVLKNEAGDKVAEGRSVAGNDDRFKVSFDAPKGGYEEYTVELYENGTLFDKLDDVVFGELWLASGQSNMHIFLRFTKTGIDMVKNGETGSDNVRILNMPLIPGYSSDPDYVPVPGDAPTESPCPLLPQEDIVGAEWFKASSEKVYNITGVGYFFAHKLQRDIDMPVGILCDYLGGSSILPWLSRRAIDSDEKVRADIGKDYIPANKWDETADYNNMLAMSALYNKKTAPLTNFHIAGMIWYQGETDCGWGYGRYSRAMELLQDSLTEDFDYSGKRLPVILATFADCALGSLTGFRKLGAELGDFAAADPTSRAVTVISDLPLGYTQDTQTVHPYEKKPVGERMALEAEGLVYNMYDHSYSSPVLKESKDENGCVYLTFSDVCDGLVCTDKAVHGFTICGKNGVYVPAKADIVSKDTVKVWSDGVGEPVAAMYSQGLITTRSNLFSSLNGEKYLPVCHTISDWNYVANIWHDCGWTDCDQKTIWHQETLKLADFYDIWKSDNSDISIDASAAYFGDAGLIIKASQGAFSVGPVTSKYDPYEDNTSLFKNWNKDLRNMSEITVMLKNNGKTELTFDGIKMYVSDDRYYSPVVKGTSDTGCKVPADGQWHKYTFDLDTLVINGKKSPLTLTRKALNNVTDIKFDFNTDSYTELMLDDIQFSPYEYAVSYFRLFGLDLITLFSKLFNI